MNALLTLIVRQRAAVLLLAIIVLITGVFAATRMQLELFPKVSFDTVSVVTPDPGAAPDAVLKDVTKPVEAAVAGVPGIDVLASTSTDNASIITIRFKFGTDIEAAQAKVSSAIGSLQFPDGVQRPKVSTLDFSAFPILYFAVRGNGPGTTVRDTYRIVKSEVQPQLEQIPGVAAADVGGGATSQVTVQLRPSAMKRTGITPAQVDAVLQANNIRVPGGDVTTGGITKPVVISGTLTSLAQIQNLPIGAAATALPGAVPGRPGATNSSVPGGGAVGVPHIVRLGDIATVARTESAINSLGTTPGEITGIVRFDGKPAISITVRKNSDANIVEVASAVRSKLNTIARQHPNLSVGLIYDSSTSIKDSVSSLLKDGIFGAVFAVLVIFVFLLTIRTTLVAAISIPLSILTALILLRFMGYTLNIMTISAVAVAVGRVVDDAIVVLENVYRHIQEGESRTLAAVSGTREVARAIIGSTLTTIAVFLPIGFIGGILGQFFQPFALTVTFALIASLVVALTVVPALGSLFITRKRHVAEETWLQRVYTPLLSWALVHRALTVIVAAVVFFASLGLTAVIPKGFFPASNETLAQASLNLPAGSAVGATTAAVAGAEDSVIRRQPGIDHWETIVGYDNAAAQRGAGASASNAATLLLTYKSGTDMVNAVDRLRADLKSYAHRGEIWAAEGVQSGPPSNVDLLITGANQAEIGAATHAVLNRLHAVPGLTNVQSNLQARKPQIEIAINPQGALLHGLTPATAALQVRQDLTGQIVTAASLNGQDTSIFVQVDPRATNTLAGLKALLLGTPPVPLAQIATVTNGAGPVAIPRQNQQNVGEVTALVNNAAEASKVTTAVDSAVQPLIKTWAARNVTIAQAGVGKEITDGFINMGYAMLIAIGLVYLIMVFLFRSLLVPFVILFSLPLAVIGALVALAVTRRTLDMSALIGVLMLIGVVVTNAVVLLDLVQQKLEAGATLHDALLQGGRTRVRPIVMTAIATILALMPLAVMGSGGGLIAANLATVVIGGLLTSTLLTLIVIPVIYSLFTSLRRRVMGGGQGEVAAVSRAPGHRLPPQVEPVVITAE